MKPDIASLTRETLQTQMEAMGQPKYRAGQVFAWLNKPLSGTGARAGTFDAMTNLPAALRAQLAEQWDIARPALRTAQHSADGTAKLLVALRDGHCVETVLMRYKHGPSVCVSSQVGCRMGCAFCASTVGVPASEGQAEIKGGLVRNLSAGEMAGQVYLAEEEAGERVSHLVLMGIGEPLDNTDNVMDFLSIITDKDGQGLSGRNISLSTCGVVPAIRRLAQEELALTLSVSLHAADDETRAAIMPVNNAFPLAELMDACRAYQAQTGRRISYEYALFAGVNDRDTDAAKLAKLLAGMGGHLNLIAANPVAGSGLTPSGDARVAEFAQKMNRAGVKTTIRRRLGADIDAACGQLRLKRAGEDAGDTGKRV